MMSQQAPPFLKKHSSLLYEEDRTINSDVILGSVQYFKHIELHLPPLSSEERLATGLICAGAILVTSALRAGPDIVSR